MIQALQLRLQAIVAAAPILAGRPVLTEDKGNLVNEVETALETQSIAVVVASANGNSVPNQARKTALFEEDIEVIIHRGALDDPSGLTTAAVLDALIPLIHGKPISATATPTVQCFRAKRHELRENGDGTYVRVLTVGVTHEW
jgi:hypothetical protein